jgi:ATP-dependent helicase/DNAse subunit B
LGDVSDKEIEEILKFAAECLEESGAAHSASRPAAWTAARERLFEELALIIRAERKENSEAIPAHFEFSFGFEASADGYQLELQKGIAVRFRGRIDRVDWLPENRLQVIDYKSGKSTNYKVDSFAGGRQLQLPLYLLAASQAFNRKGGLAQYLFTSEQKLKRQFDMELLQARLDDLRRIIRIIREAVAAGEFFALPDDIKEGGFCQRICDCRRICGPARLKLAEIKQGAACLQRLRELRAIE